MDKFYSKISKRKLYDGPGSTSQNNPPPNQPQSASTPRDNPPPNQPQSASTPRDNPPPNQPQTAPLPISVDLDNLPWDPLDRIRISNYHPNQVDEVRRKYLTRGPFQPREFDFPKKHIGKVLRRFNPAWFNQYGNWLEYSIKGDKAFCLCCYLFRDKIENKFGHDAFVTEGFSSWNKTERFRLHVGDNMNSFHNKAVQKCDDLMNQHQSITAALHKASDVAKKEYRIRLGASIDVCRILLHQGLAFRGHDETEDSSNKGNFLELFDYTAEQNEEVRKVVRENAPKNNQMISPSIQKDIVDCFAHEIATSIVKDIGGDVFSVLVDESSDVSHKEQMAMVVRFVDKWGIVKERFLCVTHVQETTSLFLKSTIDSLLSQHGLTMQKVRGQGYDGASNMRGEMNGLKALILRENSSAYYVHCFAHQLHLVVVAVAKDHLLVGQFFDMVNVLLNVVGASCKRNDLLRQSYHEQVNREIGLGVLETGSGLNQELGLARPGLTRWGSHYKTLQRVVVMYPTIMTVLEYVKMDGAEQHQRTQAFGLITYFDSFNFVFFIQLMLVVLGITDTLNVSLQKRSRYIKCNFTSTRHQGSITKVQR